MLNTNSLLGAAPVHQRPSGQTMNRACEGCRLLKIRCVPVDSATSPLCQRCERSGRMCVYAPVQQRRRRKRTDTRMTELEMEIKAMRAQLNGSDSRLIKPVGQNKSIAPLTASKELTSESEAYTDTPSSSVGRRGSEGRDVSQQISDPMLESQSENGDITSFSEPMPVKSLGDNTVPVFFSSFRAVTLFESFNRDLVPYYPLVVFPEYYSPEQARRTKPILFQAAVTAAACQTDGDLFEELFNGIVQVYADQIFIKGEKSIELVQALTLTAVWYCPPEEECGHARLQFYQYLHMAAMMAVELGIGMKMDSTIRGLEESRTLLSCYLCCAGVAKRLRRPNMVRWSNTMADCLEVLEKSQFSNMLDKRLAAWVKLQNIADEWNTDGLDASRNEIALKGFERQLERWKSDLEPGVLNSSLIMAYNQDKIHLYESTLESGSTILLDFSYKNFDPMRLLQPPKAQSLMSASQINAVMACIESSHAMLDEFLAFDVTTLQQIPIILYVRISYAIVVLIKIFCSISFPGSELSKIMDSQILKLDYYISNVINSLTAATGSKKLKIPKKWLLIISGIDKWYKRIVAVKQKEKYADPNGTAIETKKSTEELSNIDARAGEPTTTSGTKHLSQDLPTLPLLKFAPQHPRPLPSNPDSSIHLQAYDPQMVSAQINQPHSTVAQVATRTSNVLPNILHTRTDINHVPGNIEFASVNHFFSTDNLNMDFMADDFSVWAPDGDMLDGMDGIDDLNGIRYGDYGDHVENDVDGANQHMGGNWRY